MKKVRERLLVAIVRAKARSIIASIVFGILTLWFSSAASAAPTRMQGEHRVVLLYSEDDTLCNRLTDVYDWLVYHRPDAQLYDWEDLYASRFAAVGLKQLSPVSSSLYQLRNVTPRYLYYKAEFPGEDEPRLIHLEDQPFGRDGAFSTNVWIFKSTVDLASVLSAGTSGDQVQVAVLFGSAPTTVGFKSFGRPYFFKKIMAASDLAVPENVRPSKIPNIGNAVRYTIQRIYSFDHQIIILAEDELAFLAYRLRGGEIDDVCYLATTDYLNSIGWNGRK